MSAYSGIWRRIWAKIEDIGEELVRVEWVPAHLSESQARDRDLAEWKRQANQWADELAKKGAARHEGHAELEAIVGLADHRVRFVQWLARFQVAVHRWLMKHQLQDYCWPQREKQADSAPGQLLVMRMPPGTRREGKRRRRRPMDKSHALSRNGDLIWCRRCGCWSQSRVLCLAGPCRPERLQEYGAYRKRLNDLRAGRHPTSHRCLSPLEVSWNGRLDMEDDVRGQGFPATVAPRTTQVGRPFLSCARSPTDVALDAWLREFFHLFPEVGQKLKKKARAEFDDEPDDLL